MTLERKNSGERACKGRRGKKKNKKKKIFEEIKKVGVTYCS